MQQHHRAALLALLSEQQSLQLKLKTELDAYGAADPVKVEEKRRAIEVAKEACVLWIGECYLPFSHRRAGWESRGEKLIRCG